MHPSIPSYQEDGHTTSEGGREVVTVHYFSLARLARAARRARKEARVVIHEWNKSTFIYDVFGPRSTWFVPEFEASEWGFILYLFKTHSYTRVIRLSITTVGSVIIPPLGLVLYTRFLFSTRASEKVRYVGEKYADRNKEADEDWWFINGTGVNTDLQAANGYHISEIFHKQVRLFYNPTTGLLVDLAQCVVGLISYKTRPSALLAKALLNRFSQSPTVKVILIVHSMGSIISANAIKYMIRKGWTKDLHRLELYTFGSPSVDFLHVIDKRTMTRVPFYEHYCNTQDYISRIGALRLTHGNWWAIGRVFSCEKQGHFFGEHYLPSVARREYKWKGSTEHSRLYSYIPTYPVPPITYPITSSPYSIPPPDYKINPRRPRRQRWLFSRSSRSNSVASNNSLATPSSSAATFYATPPFIDTPTSSPPSLSPPSSNAATFNTSPTSNPLPLSPPTSNVATFNTSQTSLSSPMSNVATFNTSPTSNPPSFSPTNSNAATFNTSPTSNPPSLSPPTSNVATFNSSPTSYPPSFSPTISNASTFSPTSNTPSFTTSTPISNAATFNTSPTSNAPSFDSSLSSLELETATFIPLNEPLPSYITAPEPSAVIPPDSPPVTTTARNSPTNNIPSSNSSTDSTPSPKKKRYIPFFKWKTSNGKPNSPATTPAAGVGKQ